MAFQKMKVLTPYRIKLKPGQPGYIGVKYALPYLKWYDQTTRYSWTSHVKNQEVSETIGTAVTEIVGFLGYAMRSKGSDNVCLAAKIETKTKMKHLGPCMQPQASKMSPLLELAKYTQDGAL